MDAKLLSVRDSFPHVHQDLQLQIHTEQLQCGTLGTLKKLEQSYTVLFRCTTWLTPYSTRGVGSLLAYSD